MLLLFAGGRTIAQVTRGTLGVNHYERQSTLEQLFRDLSRAKTDTIKVGLLNKISSIYWRKERQIYLDSCLYFANQSLILSEKLNYTEGKNEALFLKCKAFTRSNNLKSALSLLPLVFGEMKVRLLLVISEYYVFLPEQVPSNLDSAYIYLKQASQQADSLQSAFWQRYCLLLSGKYYFERGEYDLGKQYFLKIINNYRESGDIAGQAYYWSELGLYLPLTDSAYKTKVQAHETAYQLYWKLGRREDAFYSLIDLAEVHMIYNHVDLAQKKIMKILDLGDQLKIRPSYHLYYLSAQIFFYYGNLAKGLSYLYLALEKANPLNTYEEMDANELLAKFYFSLGSYQKSIDLNQRLLNYSLSIKSYSTYIFCHRIVLGKIAVGDARGALNFLKKFTSEHPPLYLNDKEIVALSFGNVYNALRLYNKAEASYLEMITIDKRLKPEIGKQLQHMVDNIHLKSAEAYFTIGNFYIEQRRYEEARPYLLESIVNNDTKIPVFAGRGEIEYRLYLIEYAARNYLSAIKHYSRYQQIKDSVLNVLKSRQVEEVQFRYQKKQNEQSINLLRAQGVKKDQELKGLNREKNLITGAIVLLVIAIALTVRGYRLKQISIRRLQIKQEKIDWQNLQISHKNESLRGILLEKEGLIRDKESLLTELNHRVKNNLLMVISLLDEQVSFLNNSIALAALQESKNRIQAMALIHQKFNDLPGRNLIDIKEYVLELVTYLGFSFSTFKQHIQIRQFVDIEKLNISQVVPLGLIINEAVTNSIKHAFKPIEGGIITISLTPGLDDLISLTIIDNGKGLPADFELRKGSSLGMEMLINLSKQLGGTLRIKNENGLCISIEFRPIDEQLDTDVPDLS